MRQHKAGVISMAMREQKYSDMANILFKSIRLNDKRTPLCLIHQGVDIDWLDEIGGPIYTIQLDKQWDNPFYAKLNIIDLSPFDKTLFLDADSLWLTRPVSRFLSMLDGIPITWQCPLWAKVRNGKPERRLLRLSGEGTGIQEGEVPNIEGFLYYMEKGPIAQKMSDRARYVAKTSDHHDCKYRGFIDDEFCWMSACAQFDYRPPLAPWEPMSWRFNASTNMSSKWAYAFGGHAAHDRMRHFISKLY